MCQPVARRLYEAGHDALPLTLPGLGFTDHGGAHRLDEAVDFVVDAVTAWARREPVTLVGHSWGGYPMTGAGIRLGAALIREVVYVNAVVPERGVAMRDENPAMACRTRRLAAAFPYNFPPPHWSQQPTSGWYRPRPPQRALFHSAGDTKSSHRKRFRRSNSPLSPRRVLPTGRQPLIRMSAGRRFARVDSASEVPA